jgi:DNA-binding NtrC family response regulator
LTQHFLKRFSEENNKKDLAVDDAAWEHLLNYSWPGNVRELENAVERAVILCRGKKLGIEHFSLDQQDKIREVKGPEASVGGIGLELSAVSHLSLTEAVETIEKQLIAEALKTEKGNQRKTADRLGVTERILGYKIKKYGLK